MITFGGAADKPLAVLTQFLRLVKHATLQMRWVKLLPKQVLAL